MNERYLKAKQRRTFFQAGLAAAFAAVIVTGMFYPVLGACIFGCMLFGLLLAAFHGRLWCNWLCPRGSFYDVVAAQISRRKGIPGFVRRGWVRATALAALMLALGIQLALAWPDWRLMAAAFMRMLLITTAIGLVLAWIYHQRTWCYICPVGTLANWIGGRRNSLLIDSDRCIACKLCGKVCPMQIAPYRFKSAGIAEMADRDCLRCGLCIAVCPKDALAKPSSNQSQKPPLQQGNQTACAQ